MTAHVVTFAGAGDLGGDLTVCMPSEALVMEMKFALDVFSGYVFAAGKFRCKKRRNEGLDAATGGFDMTAILSLVKDALGETK